MKKIPFIFILIVSATFCISFSEPFVEKTDVVEVVGLNDSINYNFVSSEQLYAERWNVLPQPNFWRTLMQMGDDSAVINIASTRQIIKRIAVKDWNDQTDAQKDLFRDSVRTHYNLASEAKVFMTSGKRDFYDFEKVIPSIGRGIAVFKENGVDPFYAQAILLIESPNKLQKSQVGAYGSFQIMKNVAINLGLIVNKTIDEREDFDKSAWGAAKLIKTICIPELNKILDARCIEYQPTDIWYRLLVLHVYHAGAGNVKHAINAIDPKKGDINLITTLWQTEAAGFRNASQNYSQLALASMLELDEIIYHNCNNIIPCN
ncbi:lytic transglycosylase domain-containing protein [Vicingus serpentipes]|uniref:Lytic transglycosylase domain-containing protein n=1 Tax=Vicingus serpentipes TaxID=1926625 RepID=A0A5C6RU83_9FLAO|nr:transglycosylase SLT domain-containing protein [Vicingus serpentipes]TXB66036.1 lytic transglycosylase domain-containing protein [Vicingus serpentipes]